MDERRKGQVPDRFRIELGPTSQEFRLFLGDEDITQRLMVKSLSIHVSGDSGYVTANMEVYVDGSYLVLEPKLTSIGLIYRPWWRRLFR